MDRKKELKLAYKQTPPPMGIYQLKNNVNGKILLGKSLNLRGTKNSWHFQLDVKQHSNKVLQTDWNEYGSHAFTFEILENLNTEKIPEEDWRKALSELEEKWLTKLQPYGENGYNKQKK